MPLLAVLPALAVAVYLGASGERAGERPRGEAPTAGTPPRTAPADPGDPAPPPEVDREDHASTPAPDDSLMGTIGDRRSLPDSIAVLLERDLAGSGASVEEYLLWLPPGLERGDREWPVILYLHGRSLRGEDTSLLLRYGLPRYLAEGRSIPFIVVAPQVRPPEGWTDVDRLAELLDEIEARYPVDRERVYVTGYSMGGGGVWRMVFAHADRFAAAVPFAAWTPRPSPERARAVSDLPLLVYHGTADEVAPVGRVLDMVEALREAGAEVELELIEGADHGDLTTVYREPSIYEWMLRHGPG